MKKSLERKLNMLKKGDRILITTILKTDFMAYFIERVPDPVNMYKMNIIHIAGTRCETPKGIVYSDTSSYSMNQAKDIEYVTTKPIK